jgi:hypothetical protein
MIWFRLPQYFPLCVINGFLSVPTIQNRIQQQQRRERGFCAFCDIFCCTKINFNQFNCIKLAVFSLSLSRIESMGGLDYHIYIFER